MSRRRPSSNELQASWARHNAEWREPAQIASQWEQAHRTDPKLLRHRATGRWWDILQERGITLFVTREYEHLVIALGVRDGRPRVSFNPPSPSLRPRLRPQAAAPTRREY